MNTRELSLEQAAGQRLMIGFDGTRLTRELKHCIETIKVGGIVLFSRNITGPEQIKTLCRSVQDYARRCGQPPLFVAIDQEGGAVARLKAPFTEFPGNPKMQGLEDAVGFAKVTAAELKTIGVNMNLAPVLDMIPAGVDSIMADRVFGPDPDRVSELGMAVISHLQRRSIMAVAKHFPGIGRTTLDSHLDRPSLDTEFEELEKFDLSPFRAAVANEVTGMMLSHVLYTGIDANWPASLSVEIAKNLLRGRLDFKGLVLTDDLDMGAIVKYYDINTAMKQIVAADIDIALICHPGRKIEAAFESLLKVLSEGMNMPPGETASIQRILTMKKKYLSHFMRE